jgi:hypothetical protein
VVENIMKGVEFPLNLCCKRIIERTYRIMAWLGIERICIRRKNPKTNKWNNKLQGAEIQSTTFSSPNLTIIQS